MKALKQIAIACICLLVAATGDVPDAPTSATAVRARRQYEAAMEKARQEYTRAAVAADRRLIAELSSALTTAVNSKDLKESERLDAAKATAEAEMGRHLSGDMGDTVSIPGKWRVTYADGTVREYVVARNGSVSLPAEGRVGRLNTPSWIWGTEN